MTFGENLRIWRKAKGMTQPELAEASGVNVSYISNLERNFSANKKGVPQPSRDLCKRFAKVLGVPTSEVLLAANYAPENVGIYPQTPEEFTEALKRFGVCNWKIPESQMAKLSPEYFKNVIDMMESLIKGQLQKMEEGALRK